ncbi:Hypothetical predicted protein [Xyrichtys novacula]|uniref:Uncharacterized protein n=1 Tax=Xyrichtys novacula TaxID=13765 RepID=A0AAV1EIA5_XYRNO|nr:Hypothetical predicted protein [Xyrichtys novacula]
MAEELELITQGGGSSSIQQMAEWFLVLDSVLPASVLPLAAAVGLESSHHCKQLRPST